MCASAPHETDQSVQSLDALIGTDRKWGCQPYKTAPVRGGTGAIFEERCEGGDLRSVRLQPSTSKSPLLLNIAQRPKSPSQVSNIIQTAPRTSA